MADDGEPRPPSARRPQARCEGSAATFKALYVFVVLSHAPAAGRPRASAGAPIASSSAPATAGLGPDGETPIRATTAGSRSGPGRLDPDRRGRGRPFVDDCEVDDANRSKVALTPAAGYDGLDREMVDHSFGNLAARRVTWHRGRDLAPDPPPAAGPVNALPKARAEAYGEPFSSWTRTLTLEELR